MLLLKCLCILSVIGISYEQPAELGAACPKYPKGNCTYDEECPASSQHGFCGGDINYEHLVCCTSSGTNKVLKYYIAREFPERTQCGRSGALNQIYQGDRTEIGEYPWMAALLYVPTEHQTYTGVNCGGTLITEKFVLTAAHCVIDQTPESIRVLLGDWNITSDPDPYPEGRCRTSRCTAKIEYADKVINATIDKIISHCMYSSKTRRNDIALLRLKTPVQFTNYVQPICLPSKDFPALTGKDELSVAGWGITESGSRSNVLLKAKLNFLTAEDCLDKIQKVGGIHKTEFCAANLDSDACQGDSGGPLMKNYKDHRSNWFQLGIVGSGGSCSMGATATVYTSVYFFVDWIIDQITPQSERDSPCKTPDNKNGKCVLVDECPVLEQQYLQPENRIEVELVRRSLCGVHMADRSDMVCCRLSQIKRENAMEGSSCKTSKPELKDGRCVRLTNCPALKNASKTAREYVQKSQCGFDDEVLVCCNTQDIVVASEPKCLEEFPSASIPNRTICGQIRSDNTKSEYPWLATLMYRYDSETNLLRCGGSLINKRFVLTLASCMKVGRIVNYRVLLGIGFVKEHSDCYKNSDCTSDMQNLTVEQAILHPFYHSRYSLNNIALVRLGSDVVFNDYVSPVCLPPPNLQPLRTKSRSEVTVAGWGKMRRSSILLEIHGMHTVVNGKTDLWDAGSCVENSDLKKIHKQEFCIPTNDTMEFCMTASGWPIMRAYRDQLGQNLFLEGIYLDSWDCRRHGFRLQNSNVRISAYTSWILRTIANTT